MVKGTLMSAGAGTELFVWWEAHDLFVKSTNQMKSNQMSEILKLSMCVKGKKKKKDPLSGVFKIGIF